MKVVGVCGLGYTGSGAVTDLLREYEEIEYNKHFLEFSLCYYPDGLLDLKHHLCDSPTRFESSDAALYRFDKLIHYIFSTRHLHSNPHNREMCLISEKYINDITQIKWRGTWGFRISEKEGIRAFLIKVACKLRPIIGDFLYLKLSEGIMRYSINPADFLEKTVSYLEDIIEVASEKPNRIVILDQAFPGDHPQDCFVFFRDAKAIVIDRDPRDLFLLCKYNNKYDCSWIPTNDVNQFIVYYKTMRKNARYVDDPRILRIQYEDLIYDYDKTVNTIEHFLSISNHTEQGKFFVPQRSICNTQLFNKYPKDKHDIEIITKELNKWTFDYSRYGMVESKEKPW